MSERYIKLDSEDFHCLVRGGVLQIEDERNNDTINICLEDIGFYNMNEMIDNLQEESSKYLIYKNHVKIIKK